ncbi:ABC transporter substrate-binding protein [Inquilinus limosus]|uniref:ABC transporter substrate-binding protein n=1 Tax=Inquilinus limosus MP06 TaxID=1398085 RepID=A0A0A0DE21_9PROT|nr:ABC transporter substrate-binding protein [Inquilinus limosus]KGM35247.1 ABC transporter substrate-binding protein [Inquilinus limosus MP06]
MKAMFGGLALALVLAAGAAAAQDAPRDGGTITVALTADIRSTDPGINRDSNTDTVLQHVVESLVGYRADLTVGPSLAESWTVTDGGRTYDFKLRPGAVFHNGKPVTSAEVKWSWEHRWADPAWLCRPLFDGTTGLKVDAVETPDPQTVRFRLAAPNALFLAQLAQFQCFAGGVISPDSLNPDGSWNAPIGTGPYKLKSWKRGEAVVLERFAGYRPLSEPASGYAGARIAHADTIRFQIVPDPSTAEAALAAGQIDLLPSLAPAQIDQIKAAGATVETAPGLGWSTLLIQTRDPLLSDPRMRLAIAHAIDIRQVAQARAGGLADANPSAVPRASAFFDDGFLDWPGYDPAKAQALLQEAGYKGQPITIQTNKRYDGMYDSAVVVQAMLAAVGIDARLEVLDWATQLDSYMAGRFQLQSFGFSARLDPSLMYTAVIGSKAGRPTAQWDDPQAAELLAKSVQTDDPAARRAILHQMHALMARQVPIIGLYYDIVADAVGPKLKGYRPWPGGKPILWGAWKAD